MSDTKISWATKVWNPTTGCDRVSPGCANCYAMRLAAQYRLNPKMIAAGIYQNDGGPASGPGFKLTLRPEKIAAPLAWKKSQRIFVNSMSDLFHDDVPDAFLNECFAVMAACPQHTFQILTKRIEGASMYLQTAYRGDRIEEALDALCAERGWHAPPFKWPLPNVLVGPTVENLTMAQQRLPYTQRLHDVGWRTMVSYEPALGPVAFGLYMDGISWLICGGESGPGRRPFNHEWARSALAEARDYGVPFYMKQDGGACSEIFDSLPEDLKVRQFP